MGTIGLDDKTGELLHSFGMPAHLRGYGFLITAITIAVENPSSVLMVTKDIYPEVAKQHLTTPSRAERAMRHAIETAFTRGNIKVLHDFFGYTIHPKRGHPTNSEFISLAAERLRREVSA